MTIISPPVTYTPEDVARRSGQDDKLYELVGGRLVEKMNVSGLGTSRLLRRGDTFKDAPELPGFVLKLSDIFPSMTHEAINQ